MLLLLLNILSFVFQAPDKLNQDIDRYLNKELPGYERIEFKITKLPDKYKKIDIIESSHPNVNGSTIYIPVDVVNEKDKSSRTFLTLDVKLYKTVFVAKEKIDRKKAITENDFEIKRVDVAGLRGKVISVTDKLSNYRTKTFIRRDDILVSECLEKIPIILTGNRVRAFYVNGTVAIDFFVNARQDGVEGDVIRVVTKDNVKYKAKIIDSNNVIIYE